MDIANQSEASEARRNCTDSSEIASRQLGTYGSSHMQASLDRLKMDLRAATPPVDEGGDAPVVEDRLSTADAADDGLELRVPDR